MQKPRLSFRVHQERKNALEIYATLVHGKTVTDLVLEQLEPLFKAAMKFANQHKGKTQ